MGRLVLLAFVTGCWGTSQPAAPPREPVLRPEPPPPTTAFKSRRRTGPMPCERAIDNAIEVFRAELDRMGIDVGVIRTAAIASCEATAWSEATTTCFEQVKDVSAIQTCRTKLTNEQIRDLDVRIRDSSNAASP